MRKTPGVLKRPVQVNPFTQFYEGSVTDGVAQKPVAIGSVDQHS